MRIARYITPGAVYHVISRFVDRDWRLHDDEERANYLRLLGRALEKRDWRCLSYALMSNHIHLAMIAGEEPMWRWLKRVHSPFANWMNERHDRLGPLFAHRPNAWGVRPENVADLIAYIHNNPVRAGVVPRARDSSWTSHNAYIRKGSAPRWLVVAEGLRRSGCTAKTFDRWVNGCEAEPDREPLDGVHREARKRGAIELATPIADPSEVPLVGRYYARIRPDPRAVLHELASVLRISPSRISSKSTDPVARRARLIAVHAAQRLGLTISEISTALGVTRQAGSRLAGISIDEVAEGVVVVVVARFTTLTPSLANVAQVQDSKTSTR
jgi:REP element-mobilizing transposase RayT